MKYFTKYLPVEEEIKEGWEGIAYKADVKGQFFKHSYTTNPWYADAKPCKLFLCSRDIQVGDEMTWIGTENQHYMTKFGTKSMYEDSIAPLGIHPNWVKQ
jgi:hypothetical protein